MKAHTFPALFVGGLFIWLVAAPSSDAVELIDLTVKLEDVAAVPLSIAVTGALRLLLPLAPTNQWQKPLAPAPVPAPSSVPAPLLRPPSSPCLALKVCKIDSGGGRGAGGSLPASCAS